MKKIAEERATSLPICQKPKQYEEAYWYIQNVDYFMKHAYPQPCVELLMPINVRETKIIEKDEVYQRAYKRSISTKLNFYVNYTAQSYQEVNNAQEFSFISMFSSIGGFIGIFVGTSLLQIPELFQDSCNNYIPKIKKMYRVTVNALRAIVNRGM
jgi:hypothetical protein